MLQIFLNLWLIPDFPTGADSKLPSSFKDACGYSNLEYDLEAGRRGERYSHFEKLLCRITGAEAAWR